MNVTTQNLPSPKARNVSVVTGAAGGIGHAIAQALIQRGDHVIAADLQFRDTDIVRAVSKQLGDAAALRPLDISNEEEVNATVKETLERFSRIDCLVNAVGVTRVGPFYEQSEADWNLTMNANLKGAFLLSKAVIRPMISQHWGRILHVGSTASHTAAAGGAIYAASKHGMMGLVRGMACDVSKFGITVNLLCPGNTDTEMLRVVLAERAERLGCTVDDIRAEITGKTPAGRLGHPKDVVGAVEFLTSEQAEFITGQALTIDGGRSLNLV